MKTIKKDIRWGILGLGKIAHKFANDLKLAEGSVLESVASRSEERAKAFAVTHGASSYFGSYEAMFQHAPPDIVYIASPHSLHMEHTLMALEYGVAVLCEKPFAINSAQAIRMIDSAIDKKVYLMEALWSRFIPVMLEVRQRIADGEIGELKYINADFSFKAPMSIQRVHDLELGGGSLLDIGIYPVFLAYLFLGIPEEIEAIAEFFDSGADKQLSMVFRYPGAHALLYSSFLSNSERVARISGTLGELCIHAPWNESDSYHITRNGETTRYEHPTRGRGYTYEIESCNRCLHDGLTENPDWTHRNSLELMQLLDRIRKIIGLQYPMES
jgi:predicted dehydrogenase